jgi:hypothetical protein
MDQDFIDFIDGHALVQLLVQSWLKLGQIAACGERRYGDGTLFFAFNAKFLAMFTASQSVVVQAGMAAVLFIADVLQPFNTLAFKHFLNGDESHGGGGRGTLPVFFARWDPDHITGTDLIDGPVFPLHQTVAGCDDQGLSSEI